MEGLVIAGGIISSLIAAEIYLWLPTIAQKLLSYHASKMPIQLSERLLEEWNSVLENIPGNIGKILFALDLFRAVPQISFEFTFPSVKFKPFTDASIRLVDILVATVGLLLSLPVICLAAAAIKLADKRRPILERTELFGRSGKPFFKHKFRTVYQTLDGEICISRVGRVLRLFRIDEIPYQVNIFKGEMSFVGPRPLKKQEVLSPLLKARLAVRPGITGLSQLHGPLSLNAVDHDLFYINNRSVFLYFKVIVLTYRIVFKQIFPTLTSRW